MERSSFEVDKKNCPISSPVHRKLVNICPAILHNMWDDEIKLVTIESRRQKNNHRVYPVKTYIQAELVEKGKAEQEMKKESQMTNEICTLKQTIHTALKSKKLYQLESVVGEAIAKGYTTELGVEIAEAREAVDRMKRLQKLMQGVLDLNQKSIAEIRSYSNPPEEVYKVMKNWKNVQSLIGKTGKMSLKRRVTEFDIESLHLDVALRRRQILVRENQHSLSG